MEDYITGVDCKGLQCSYSLSPATPPISISPSPPTLSVSPLPVWMKCDQSAASSFCHAFPTTVASSPLELSTEINTSFLGLLFVVAFYHSHRKVTDTKVTLIGTPFRLPGLVFWSCHNKVPLTECLNYKIACLHSSRNQTQRSKSLVQFLLRSLLLACK